MWAIEPDALATIESVLRERLSGSIPTSEEIEQRIEAAGGRSALSALGLELPPGLALVTMSGPLARRMDWMMEMSGGTDTETLRANLGSALADPSVKGVLLFVDSPGGTVDGTEEAADLLKENRLSAAPKPVLAYVEGMMASAAYWIGSWATEIVSAPNAEIGSLGVIARRFDLSRANDAAGLGVHDVTFPGPRKGEHNPDRPATDDSLSALQATVDAIGSRMYTSIAAGRGVKVADLRDAYGGGRTYHADQALERGMIDGQVANVEGAIARLEQLAGLSPAQGDITMTADEVRAAVEEGMKKALASVEARFDAIEARFGGIEASIKEQEKSTAKSAVLVRLQAAADAGKIAPGDIAEEAELLSLASEDLRDRRLKAIEARSGKVPTGSSGLGRPQTNGKQADHASARQFSSPSGGADAAEVAAVAMATAEGLTGAALAARVQELVEVSNG